MGGFFGLFDYSKPGPGIAKDAPPKPRVMVFLDIFTRKFWNLIKINLLFSIFNIPALVLLIFMGVFSTSLFPPVNGIDLYMDLIVRLVIGSFFICIPLITVGPAQAGFTYLLRNYAREEHAFIWSDFKEHALKNFKESVIISLVDLVVVLLVVVDIYLYLKMSNGSILFSIATAFLALSFVVFLMMHLYIYPMLVTFKLSIKQIYKNALIFSIIRFLPNLGILLLCAVLLVVTFYLPVVGFILFPLITVSTISLITNFYVYPSLKKYMIDKVEGQAAAPEETGNP